MPAFTSADKVIDEYENSIDPMFSHRVLHQWRLLLRSRSACYSAAILQRDAAGPPDRGVPIALPDTIMPLPLEYESVFSSYRDWSSCDFHHDEHNSVPSNFVEIHRLVDDVYLVVGIGFGSGLESRNKLRPGEGKSLVVEICCEVLRYVLRPDQLHEFLE